MIKIVMLVVVVLGIVGTSMYFHILPKPNIRLSSLHFKPSSASPIAKSLDEITNSSASGQSTPEALENNQNTPGKVAGISTEKLGDIGQSISQKGSGIAQAVGSVFTSKEGDKQVTIDVQAISDQIGVQMDKLPAQLVEKAKVAYCQQVMLNATTSGNTH